MRKERLFLILSIILILILLLLSEFQKPVVEGKIKEIKNGFPKTIVLENPSVEILIFDKQISLKKENEIKIFGSFQNKNQIIATKIICLNC
ncbi:MAG: hypothetical protein QXX68_01705 [Candidatus Pacearchaeota archaeon]